MLNSSSSPNVHVAACQVDGGVQWELVVTTTHCVSCAPDAEGQLHLAVARVVGATHRPSIPVARKPTRGRAHQPGDGNINITTLDNSNESRASTIFLYIVVGLSCYGTTGFD
jgi:hypothetical protein